MIPDVLNTIDLYLSTHQKEKIVSRWTIGYKKDVMAYYLSCIYKGVLLSDTDSNNPSYYINLSCQKLKQANRQYNKYFNLLENAGLIKRCNTYLPAIFDKNNKGFSKSYSFTTKALQQKVRGYTIKNQQLINNINKMDWYVNLPLSSRERKKILTAHISTVENVEKCINNVEFKSEIGRNKTIVEIHNIQRKAFRLKKDDAGREYTNLTGLKKEIRKQCILIDNEHTHEEDIPNSQPIFLHNIIHNSMNECRCMYDNNIDMYNVSRFRFQMKKMKTVLSAGLFYEQYMTQWKKLYGTEISRDEAKRLVFRVFYGVTTSKSARSCKNIKKSTYHAQRCFKSIYSEIYAWIVNYKKKHGGYKKGVRALAKEVQKAESDYIFGKCMDLFVPHYTVHDSIVVKKSDAKCIVGIFDDVLK